MEWMETQQVWARVMGKEQGLTGLLLDTATAVSQYDFLAEQTTGFDRKVLGKLAKLEDDHLATLETICYFAEGTCPAIHPVVEQPTCLTVALRDRYRSAQGRRNQLLQLANQCPALETRLLHMAQELAWSCDALLALAKRRLGTMSS